MRRRIRLALILGVFATAAAELHAAADRGFTLSVVVGGRTPREYASRGTVYVEALRGVPYALRLTNPCPQRMAVALSVDGLNTIDARRTTAGEARKWVIEPYGSITIPGWQVSGSAARAFFFAGEKRSYAASLSETENLGVIEAVFYRERIPVPAMGAPAPETPRREGSRRDAAPGNEAAASGALSDDFAATGMGNRREHPVVEVALDLDPRPAARIRIRYEFRPQLEALGILSPEGDPGARRERASGFEEFCPEVR